jgi:hypothetical protein
MPSDTRTPEAQELVEIQKYLPTAVFAVSNNPQHAYVYAAQIENARVTFVPPNDAPPKQWVCHIKVEGNDERGSAGRNHAEAFLNALMLVTRENNAAHPEVYVLLRKGLENMLFAPVDHLLFSTDEEAAK